MNTELSYKNLTKTHPYLPGQVLTAEQIATHGKDAFFSIQPLPDSVFAFMQGKSIKDNCSVPRESLCYLMCLHCDLERRTIVGEMVLSTRIADDVLQILRALYDNQYPIERMRLVDFWDADDESCMRENNSSSFNFRLISHTTQVSKHGLGMAVDINPLYNPYYKIMPDGTEVLEPATARPYLDRKANYPYKIVKGDLCYEQFIAKGFIWGGEWDNRKDYQHFERP